MLVRVQMGCKRQKVVRIGEVAAASSANVCSRQTGVSVLFVDVPAMQQHCGSPCRRWMHVILGVCVVQAAC
jgi:hypothetical protein